MLKFVIMTSWRPLTSQKSVGFSSKVSVSYVHASAALWGQLLASRLVQSKAPLEALGCWLLVKSGSAEGQ